MNLTAGILPAPTRDRSADLYDNGFFNRLLEVIASNIDVGVMLRMEGVDPKPPKRTLAPSGTDDKG